MSQHAAFPSDGEEAAARDERQALHTTGEGKQHYATQSHTHHDRNGEVFIEDADRREARVRFNVHLFSLCSMAGCKIKRGVLQVALLLCFGIAFFCIPGQVKAGNPVVWPYGGTIEKQQDIDPLRHVLLFHEKVNFDSLAFSAKTFFYGHTFPGLPGFRDTQFLGGPGYCVSRFERDIRFRDTHFKDAVFFNESVFGHDVDFQDATFGGSADFTASSFDGVSRFYASRFDKQVDKQATVSFGTCRFSKAAYFDGSEFLASLNFSRATFRSIASFNESHFSGTTSFDKTTFNSFALFRGVCFSLPVSFRESRFHEAAMFQGAQFSGATDFRSTTFNNDVSFHSARFQQHTVFENTAFYKVLNLTSTHFQEGLDFRLSRFGDSSIIFVDDKTLFPSGRFFCDWSFLKGKLRVDDTASATYQEWKAITLLLRQLDGSAVSSDSSSAFAVLKNKRDDLSRTLNHQRYELFRIFYDRLRENYLAQGNKAAADEVMYELAEKETELLGEFRMQLYGWVFGWGYRPLRFLLKVLLPLGLFFAWFWYNRYYHLVAPLVDDDIREEMKNKGISMYGRNEIKTTAIVRWWHVLHFSASLLLSIRFREAWIHRHDRDFLFWVTAEWILGIIAYITFVALVKSNEFSYIKGLLGF